MPTLPRILPDLVDPIWEQQPTEAKSHYLWFTLYAGLKPFERTYQKTWDILQDGGSKQGTACTHHFKECGGKWHWRERAAAKDLFDAQTVQARWTERDRERRERAYEIGGKLVTQAERALDKIDSIPAHDLKISISEAKDAAATGFQLQEAAIPKMQLQIDQMQWVLSVLPPEKRNLVLDKLQEMRDNPHGLLMESSARDDDIEAEYVIQQEELDGE